MAGTGHARFYCQTFNQTGDVTHDGRIDRGSRALAGKDASGGVMAAKTVWLLKRITDRMWSRWLLSDLLI